jgi:hypothetical protein
LIPFSEALSTCQRASGFVVSIPAFARALEIVQTAIVHRRAVPKTQRRRHSQAIAHIFFAAAADGILKPRKGPFNSAVLYIFAGLAITLLPIL